MSSVRSRVSCFTIATCLLSASVASGDSGRRGDDPPAPSSNETAESTEHLFYTTLAGQHADEIVLPEGIINDPDAIMVYQHRFGIYPHITMEGEVINGGIPQNVDIQEHLRELERDINFLIPEGYDGYVIIDYEEWHPFWEDTALRYRLYVLEQWRERKPDWDDAKIERKARKDFEKAAKKFIKRTLDRCHQLRPDAKFGIWAYPRAKFRDNNARWLWDRHDAFFPTVYFPGMLVDDDVELQPGEIRRSDYIADRMVGRIAFADELAGDDRKVLPVVWPRYSNYNENQWLRLRDLNEADLTLALEMPFEYGADGIVIWDNIPQPGYINTFQDQIDYQIAPEIRRILTSMGLPTDGVENAVDPGDDQEEVEGLGESAEVVDDGEEFGRGG